MVSKCYFPLMKQLMEQYFLLVNGKRGMKGDFLPAEGFDGKLSIGREDATDPRRWRESIFYYDSSEALLSGMWASARIGCKLPSDDPDFPNEASPHIDLAHLKGVGFDEFRIWQDPMDFFFKISRRVGGAGSWIPIMTFDSLFSPPRWMFGASFVPTETNAFDFGTDNFRWRDIKCYRYLDFFGFVTLPSPSVALRRRFTYSMPSGMEKDKAVICRKRTNYSYLWKDVLDSFNSIALLKDIDGITVTDIGITDVEILPVSFRSRVALENFDSCRVVFGGVNNEAVAFFSKIQYSTDGEIWSDLTPEASSDETTNEQLIVGSWGVIPLASLDDVFIRAVGRAGNATADPIYKAIELQIR